MFFSDPLCAFPWRVLHRRIAGAGRIEGRVIMTCDNCGTGLAPFLRCEGSLCDTCEQIAQGDAFAFAGPFMLELNLTNSPVPWSRKLSGAEVVHFEDRHLLGLGPCTGGRLGLQSDRAIVVVGAPFKYTPLRQLSARGLRLAAARLILFFAENLYGAEHFVRRMESQRPPFDDLAIASQESNVINTIDVALGIGERAIAVLVYEFSHYIVMHKEREAFESAHAVACAVHKKTQEVSISESNRRFDLQTAPFAPRDEEELQENRRLLESEQQTLSKLQAKLNVANSRYSSACKAWQRKCELARQTYNTENLRVLKRRLDRLVIPRRTKDESDYDSYSDIEEARATKKRKSSSGGAEAVPRAAAAASESTDTAH